MSKLITENDLRGILDKALPFGTTTKVLWSGVLYMFSGQTAPLSENVSDQKNGIVLVWSAYSSGQAQNYDWNYQFVHKNHVAVASGAGICHVMSNANFAKVGAKYVYVNNDNIAGNDYNDDTGTASGVTYANNYWVLRYVLGV